MVATALLALILMKCSQMAKAITKYEERENRKFAEEWRAIHES